MKVTFHLRVDGDIRWYWDIKLDTVMIGSGVEPTFKEASLVAEERVRQISAAFVKSVEEQVVKTLKIMYQE